MEMEMEMMAMLVVMELLFVEITMQLEKIKKPILQFGSSGNLDGQFNIPICASTNSRGEMIVCDKDNHRIQIFDHDGKFFEEIWC